MEDNTNRFSDKSENYAKYRPGYPVRILQFLKDYNFCDKSIIADIGSGTGILTKIFLENGNNVYAVEPNEKMREKANSLLNKFKNYFPINGTAENTTLPNNSVDFIVVGTAFHWFDATRALNEFRRILIENGVLVLIWNDRKTDTLFLTEYETILKTFSKEYQGGTRRNISDDVIEKYFRKDFKKITLENNQEFSFDELIGRFSSSSYSPKEGTSEYNDSYNLLKRIFDQYKINNKVLFKYDTNIFIGRI